VVLAYSLALPVGAEAGEKGGAGHFGVGIIRPNLGSLNGKLTENGYPGLGDSVTVLGGGGYGIIDRLVIGGGGGGFTQTAANDQYSSTLEGGYGLFQLGYIVHSTERSRLFPLVGIGGAGATLRLRDLKRTAPGLGQAFTAPNEVAYSTGSGLLDLGLGADFFLGGDDSPKRAGLIAGLRIGYLHSFGQQGWKMGGSPAPGLPSFGLDGPYLRLTIGGGGSGWDPSE
jgi:hypothetical protein